MVGRLLAGYLKGRGGLFAAYGGMLAIFCCIHLLYGHPFESMSYSLVLAAVLGGACLAVSFSRYAARQAPLWGALRQETAEPQTLPEGSTALEADYRSLCLCLARQLRQGEERREVQRREMSDYYTLWVHQIKTPISAMDLMLQSPQPLDRGEMRQELFKVRQYVQMALSYLRLESLGSDLVLRPTALRPLVSRVVRELKTLFINGRVSIELGELDCQVVTDEKWLTVMLEQLLTNAVKYTPAGGQVRVFMKGEKLTIRDTGIGIRPEDVPRVFDRGFTGLNGRREERSTGIGLYLCKKIARHLGHELSLSSQVGKGTAVTVDLTEKKLEIF